MTDEPSNEQLANFLVVYSKQIPSFENVNLTSSSILFWLEKPEFRKIALYHHQRFQDNMSELHRQMEKGELQCEHIRPNNKRCPNHNEPGNYYCGLHQDNE